MKSETAIRALSALAHEARLDLFRLLVKAGPDGMAAGKLARALKTAPNTLSAQLLLLSQAGLIRARREGRFLIYAVDFTAMGAVLVYLTEDCCGGNPQVCAPLAEATARAACCG